ncbi:MAG TPA: hypothetical protein VHD36_23190, partial [Pirellulales bacterium]|nr:hypothetical protein [Pirellulales bacterium]
KNSTGCDIAGMRWQNIDVSRYFASRAKLCFALGEVEKSHEGFFQQAARPFPLPPVNEPRWTSGGQFAGFPTRNFGSPKGVLSAGGEWNIARDRVPAARR